MSGEIDTTSSIGASWPPTPSSHDRIRGFYPTLVDSTREARAVGETFAEWQAQAAANEGISRLSIRVVGNRALAASIEAQGIEIEGALPLRNYDELSIMYLAWNDPKRRATAIELVRHACLLRDVTTQPDRLVAANHVHSEQVSIVDRSTTQSVRAALVEKFDSLYGSFGYSHDDVETILANTSNTVAYFEDDGGIISTALAEQATIDIADFGKLTLVEITEAITRPQSRGLGFYRTVSRHLVDQLLARDAKEIDVLYGESNLTMPGVILSAHRNGRSFSFFDRDLYGVQNPNFGILQQNFSVQDGTETRAYNDFALSYIP